MRYRLSKKKRIGNSVAKKVSGGKGNEQKEDSANKSLVISDGAGKGIIGGGWAGGEVGRR